VIKTFRGILATDTQTKIRLSTKKGKLGYRIIKFQIVPKLIASQPGEHVMKVFKVQQSSNTETIDFSDGNLLAAAVFLHEANTYYPHDFYSIFDKEIFNQDIYVTHKDSQNNDCNYYIELETEPLTDNAAAVSTLRDIRLNPQVGA